MRPIRDLEKASEKLLEEAGTMIRAALKELLEKKHLYQSASLSETDLTAPVKSFVIPADQEKVTDYFVSCVFREWYADFVSPRSVEGRVRLNAPDVKLFCESCDRLEAFNPIGLSTLASDDQENAHTVQVFAFSYLCQACKSIPEVFIVRRVGLKLTLCGRAPIEHVEVPSYIPKPIQSFYRGGLLAYQSGQVLAGNFMLRTVIEQWARLATRLESATKADVILDAYMDSLPVDFKARFSSMRDLYAALSSDIHGAVGSSELFDKAQAGIAEHFEARRLYKIS